MWAPRPRLRVISGALDGAPGSTWFCSRCAAGPEHELVSPDARVCPSCGIGVLLETRSSAAPAREDAFLVVDARLTVQAVSRHAQALLGAMEADLIGRPVARLLGAAEAEAEDDGSADLMTLLSDASAGSDEVRSVRVRPLGAFGVRVTAHIAPCGPPRAALVVLRGGTPFPTLRAV